MARTWLKNHKKKCERQPVSGYQSFVHFLPSLGIKKSQYFVAVGWTKVEKSQKC